MSIPIQTGSWSSRSSRFTQTGNASTTATGLTPESTFRQYAKSIRDFLEGCDIAGFNVIKFDLPCIEAEFTRAGVEFSRKGRSLVDSMVIYHHGLFC